jgi:hypothetical protein
MASEGARALRDVAEQGRRRAMLADAHIAPLAGFVASLRQEWPFVPDFDPLDGGVGADILFLFEKPGPKTAPPKGSGFISRDNDDPTAETTKTFMECAGIDRKRTLIWNTVPAWNRTITIRSGEVRAGLLSLARLLPLLPKLRTVVLAGRKAERAEPILDERGLKIVRSVHPSARVRNTMRHKWESIPNEWAKALANKSY